MKVLYYVGDGLGNIVHATPAIEAIRRTEHDLTVAVLSRLPDATKLIDHDKVVEGKQAEGEYDYVFASPPLGMVQVDRAMPTVQENTEVESNFSAAEYIGYEGPMPAPKVLHSDETPVEKPYVVLTPGYQKADEIWHHKRYPHWPNVAAALVDKSIPVVIIGSAKESEWWFDRHINLCGRTTLWQLTGVLANAALVIGCDNGPTTVSAALDVPTIVLWGPTNMHKNKKYGKSVLNIAASIACRPCQFSERMVRCHTAACMNLIGPEQVIREAVSVWNKVCV